MKSYTPISKFLLFFLFFSLITQHSSLNTLFAQVPKEFNYQAVARDGSAVLDNATIDVRFEILQGSAQGTSVWSEVHTNVATNALGLFSLKVGSETAFTVDWTAGPYFLNVQLDLQDGSGYRDFGNSELLSVPFALNTQSVSSLEKLDIQGPVGMDPDSALFEVKRNDGQTIFAVYNSGVRMFVEEGESKSRKGGFAIGGFTPGKGETGEYFRVTPDSVRIYLDTVTAKRPKGGFAIGGYTPGKGIDQEYMRVTQDSVRIYLDDTETKSRKGGFAIGGFTPGKDGSVEGDHYFNVSTQNEAYIINPSQPRVLWYPKKEAFLTGMVLIEDSDSVGQNSMATGFESKSIGANSQAFGYKARAKGDNSTAIGNNANAIGNESYAIGNYAMAQDSGSYAIGSGASATGLRSFALGSTGIDSAGVATSPTMATADYAYAFGMGSEASGKGAFAFGTQNRAIGDYSLAMGYSNEASEFSSTAIGIGATASGIYSIAIGRNLAASGWGSLAMGDLTLSDGMNSTAMGYSTYAHGTYSTAMGYSTNASGTMSTAMGYDTDASGPYSLATGYNTHANNSVSTAMGGGTTAYGWYSTAMGGNTFAEGSYSTAMGWNTHARTFISFVIGRYNEIAGSSTSWIATDPLFIIGNGDDNSHRNNAVTVLKNGNFGIGTTSPGQKLDVAGNIELNGYLIGAFGTIAQSTDEWLRLNPSNSHSSGTYVLGNLRADGGLYVGDDERFYRAAEDVIQTPSDLKISGGDIQLFYGTKAISIRQDGAHSYISNRQNFVGNGSTTNGRLILNGEGGVILKYGVGTSSGIDGLILTETGRVGIGTISPGTIFAIAGLTGTTSGSYLRIYNNNVYYYSSSRETKEEIQPLSEDFSKILKAQPVSFTDKASGERNIGYIAEDFDEIGLDKLVIYEDGKAKSLSYELVSLYNLEIIKKQQETIENLQEEINKLKSEKSELALLKEQVAELRESMGLVGDK